MKKYLLVLFIVMAAGIALFLFFNQGLFTATDRIIQHADDVVEVTDDSAEPVEDEDADAEEEVEVDAPEEEVTGEASEPGGSKGQGTDDDAVFTITETPHQDFIRARLKGESIVLKFYSRT